MNTKLWVYLYQQMHMVWHDFHLYEFNLKPLTDFYYKFFEPNINTIDQYFAAIFGTPNNMIFTGVHNIMITFISHEKIVPQPPI